MANPYSYKMTFFTVGCVFICYFIHVLLARQQGCSFSVHSQSEKNSPILLQNDMALIVPTNGKINLKALETITLVCPDSKNYLVGLHSNITKAQCLRGDILRVDDQDINFPEFQCHRVIKGTVLSTTRRCGNNAGYIQKIGYQISPKNFVAVIEVCYDDNSGRTLYSEHLLHGNEIKYASKSNYRPAFSTEGTTLPVGSVYKQSFQKNTFMNLLGSPTLADQYIGSNSYLARGHLSPDADFLYATTQYSTYYYINVCPQWQAINNGNWKKIENLVRKFALNNRETLAIITGTHGILVLPNARGISTEIYLSNNKIPVPKFIWKIVYSKKTRRAIVLVTINNSFIESVNDKDLLCKSICKESGWSLGSWGDYERGYTYCCTYQDFVKVVGNVPKLQVSGVLSGVKI